QLLIGHGCFQTYMERIGKAPSSTCVLYDSGLEDTVTHVIEQCQRFETNRRNLHRQIGRQLKTSEIVTIMLEDVAKWNFIFKFVEEIMRTKEYEERHRQRQ